MEDLFGEWWVPGRSSPAWGRLRLDRDVFTLGLGSNPLPHLSAGYSVAVVHGESEGRPITLFRGQEVARSSAGGGPFGERLAFGAVVLGDHLESWRSAAFREIEVTMAQLSDFIGSSGLSFETAPTTPRTTTRQLVEWRAVDEPRVSVDRMALTFHSEPRFEYISHYEFRLHHHSWVTMRAPRQLSLATWDGKWLDGLCSLVSLGVESPVGVDRWFAYHEPVPTSGLRGRTVEILVRRRTSAPSRVERSLFDGTFLTLAALGSEAGIAVRGFYHFRRRHREAAELFFEYQVLAGWLTPPDRFLYLARFLEAFHRTRFPSSRRRGPTFKDRLTHVLTGPGATAAPHYGASPARLSDLIRDTRNYYVHYDPADEAKAVHDVELDDLADRLWMIVRACVLSEIGISPRSTAAALGRHSLANLISASRLSRPSKRQRAS